MRKQWIYKSLKKWYLTFNCYYRLSILEKQQNFLALLIGMSQSSKAIKNLTKHLNIRLEGFVLLWKKNDQIISVGQQILDKVKYYFIDGFTYW